MCDCIVDGVIPNSWLASFVLTNCPCGVVIDRMPFLTRTPVNIQSVKNGDVHRSTIVDKGALVARLHSLIDSNAPYGVLHPLAVPLLFVGLEV